MHDGPAVSDPIAEELRLIRRNVPGVRGSVTATSDGLLVAHDMPGLEPTQVAALVAATHAVAVRTSLSTECGQLKEVITRGSDGYLAVYSAGETAVVAVLGTSELNVAMLNFQARKMLERIAGHSAGLGRSARTPAAGGAPPARSEAAPTESARSEAGRSEAARAAGEPLPVRRPRRK